MITGNNVTLKTLSLVDRVTTGSQQHVGPNKSTIDTTYPTLHASVRMHDSNSIGQNGTIDLSTDI